MRGQNLSTTEKYVTMSVFEDAMAAIARSFQQVDARFEHMEQRFEQKFEKVFEEFRLIHEDNREFRNRLISLERTLLLHDRKLENALVRVEKLESKIA